VSKEQKMAWRTALGVGHWETVFLSVGRNTNRKQQPRLLRAFKDMLSRHPKPESVGLVMHVGDPTNVMGMGGWNLPEMLHDMDLMSNVTFTDSNTNPLHGLPREDMARLYGMADVHVLSTGGEGFGVPSAEAMACGLPIILPDNSTGPELTGAKSGVKSISLFKGDERGILVANATHITGPKYGVQMGLVDVHHLSNALLQLAVDEDMRARMGANARAFAEKHFDWEVLVDEAERIMYEAIDTPHPLGNNVAVGH